MVQTQVLLRSDSAEVVAKLNEIIDNVIEGELEIVPEKEEKSAADETSLRRMKVVIKYSQHVLEYPALLVNLPTLVETHKTFDKGKHIYKSGDVGQAVIVYGEEAARKADEGRKHHKAWQHVHQDGISAPLRNCVERRFIKARRRRAKVQASPSELRFVEKQISILVKVSDPFAEEVLSEDIVPFEPWMLSKEHPNGAIFSDDTPLSTKKPWVFIPNQDQYTELTLSNDPTMTSTSATEKNNNTTQPPAPALPQSSAPEEESATLNNTAAEPLTAAARKRQTFVTRRTQCTDELKLISTEIETVNKAIKAKNLLPSNLPQLEAKRNELTAKQKVLRREISQLDEQLLKCELEAASLAAS